MALLEFLEGLYDLYLLLIAGPRTLWRWFRRLRQPTATEQALAGTPQMQRFWRNVRFLALGWLALGIAGGLAFGSLWIGLAVVVMGVLGLPREVESRYDRLVERLAAMPRP